MMFCFEMWGLEMNVHQPSFEAVSASIVLGEGVAHVQFAMSGFAMNWWGSATVAQMSYGGSGVATAAQISVAMTVGIEETPAGLSPKVWVDGVATTGFDLEADDFMYQAAEHFGMPLDQIAQGMAEEAFAKTMLSSVPARVQALLDDAHIAREVPVASLPFTLVATPTAVSITPSLAQVRFATDFPGPSPAATADPGSFFVPAEPSPPAASDQVTMRLSHGMLNRVLHTVWANGVLDGDRTLEELGLPAEAGAMFGAAGEVRARLSSLLPATVTPSPTGPAGFTWGDVIVELYDTAAPEQNLLSMALSFEGDLGLAPDATDLRPALSNVEVYATILDPGALPPRAGPMLESQLLPLVADAFPALMSATLALPMDLFEDVTITPTQASTTGADRYATVEVALSGPTAGD